MTRSDLQALLAECGTGQEDSLRVLPDALDDAASAGLDGPCPSDVLEAMVKHACRLVPQEWPRLVGDHDIGRPVAQRKRCRKARAVQIGRFVLLGVLVQGGTRGSTGTAG